MKYKNYINLLEEKLVQQLNLVYNTETGRWDCGSNVNISV